MRIDNMVSEHNRIHSENEKHQVSRDELDRQYKRFYYKCIFVWFNFVFSRLEKVNMLKADIAAKTAEINECRNNQNRLERQLQVAVDQKSIVSLCVLFFVKGVYNIQATFIYFEN